MRRTRPCSTLTSRRSPPACGRTGPASPGPETRRRAHCPGRRSRGPGCCRSCRCSRRSRPTSPPLTTARSGPPADAGPASTEEIHHEHVRPHPTVVLVHGAFVDASSWNGIIAELKAAGLDVVAPPNLLRGVGVDAAYLTGFVEALGRRGVLVAHSYAGAVISQTGSDASNVAGLVYVAAYAPEAGETLGAINARYPDVPLSAALRTFTYTDERGEQATDTFVDP